MLMVLVPDRTFSASAITNTVGDALTETVATSEPNERVVVRRLLMVFLSKNPPPNPPT